MSVVFGLRVKMLVLFGLLAIVSVSNLGLISYADHNANVHNVSVQHTNKVIERSEALLGHIRDAETGQRGFLLTSQGSYLEPYLAGVRAAEGVFQTLKILTQDNAVQQKRLDELYEQMTLKFRELGSTIVLMQNNQKDAALKIVFSDQGKRHMEMVRALIEDFQQEEHRLLGIHNREYQVSREHMRWAFVLEACVLVIALLLGSEYVQRSIVRPLIDLRENARKMADGQRIVPLPDQRKDEIGGLSRDFNRMHRKVTAHSHALEKANRAKSEFLAAMSHDLRTPLNAILGYSDLMRMKAFGPLGDRHYEEYIEDIHNSGSLLVSLINDILDLSKIEAGKYKLEEKPIDLHALCDVCIRQNGVMAAQANLTIDTDVPRTLPHLKGDERVLIQLMNNLMSNAIKFSKEGGLIVACAFVAEDRAMHIMIKDTGCGMHEKDVAKALRPFEQADSTIAHPHLGSGLGLFLCQNIMQLFGGEMEIESTLGSGTTVTLIFPPERTMDS